MSVVLFLPLMIISTLLRERTTPGQGYLAQCRGRGPPSKCLSASAGRPTWPEMGSYVWRDLGKVGARGVRAH